MTDARPPFLRYRKMLLFVVPGACVGAWTIATRWNVSNTAALVLVGAALGLLAGVVLCWSIRRDFVRGTGQSPASEMPTVGCACLFLAAVLIPMALGDLLKPVLFVFCCALGFCALLSALYVTLFERKHSVKVYFGVTGFLFDPMEDP